MSSAFERALEAVLDREYAADSLAAFRLLGRIGETYPTLVADAVQVLLAALLHDATDVQSAAVAALEALCPVPEGEMLDALATLAPGLGGRSRSALATWLEAAEAGSGTDGTVTSAASAAEPVPPEATGEPAAPTFTDPDASRALAAADARVRTLRRLFALDAIDAARDDPAPAIPAARFDGTDIPRLARGARLAPMDGLDELIATCARAIEDEGDGSGRPSRSPATAVSISAR